MEKTIRIGILDDHPIIFQGITKMLEASPGIKFKVDLTATSIPVLMHKLESKTIDILLLDLSLGNPMHHSLSTEGRQVLPLLAEKHPNVKVIIYSQFNDDNLRAELIAEGACAYLCKKDDNEELPDILRKVHKNGSYFDQQTARAMSRRLKTKRNTALESGLLAGWKPEHIECMRLTVKGCSVKKIADTMNKGENTIKGYRKIIYRKTGCKNPAELANWASEKDLFQEENTI